MRKIIFITIFSAIILSPVILWLMWKYGEAKKMNILIIDKTVLSQPAQEHISFCWVLKNRKYVRWDGKFYDAGSDYLGFYPFKNKKYYTNGLEKRDSVEIATLAELSDMVYFTDCYGIYTNDWYDKDPNERSTKIYGGLSKGDLLLMKEMLKRKKLVISEFNCMGSPTNRENRNEFESIYRLKWTGWIGRYFDELDTNKNKEIPKWVVRNYLSTKNNIWDFSGQGLIFVDEAGKVVVLEERRHLNGAIPNIHTTIKDQIKYNLPEVFPYPFWFEINLSSRKNNVISVFKINSNRLGDSILYQNNILKVFPASIEIEYQGNKLYYFSADFADNPIEENYAKFKYINYIKKISVDNKSRVKRENFFYTYYYPLISNILDENYNKTKNNFKKEIPFYRGVNK